MPSLMSPLSCTFVRKCKTFPKCRNGACTDFASAHIKSDWTRELARELLYKYGKGWAVP